MTQNESIPSSEDLQKAVESMILSASGWRKVFAISNDEEDSTKEIGTTNAVVSALIADVFASYILQKKGKSCAIAFGIDSRPTGTKIAEAMLKVLVGRGVNVHYLSITAAPEIMAYSRKVDGFVYVSASHNPIGHNGIKFGMNDGGVLSGEESAKLANAFKAVCKEKDAPKKAMDLVCACKPEMLEKIFSESRHYKAEALKAYFQFTKQVVSGTDEKSRQDALFSGIKQNIRQNPISIICDMNGSARTLSIDNDFFGNLGIKLYTINGKPGQIAHAIIPEPENLVHCADKMAEIREHDSSVILGYMPDCDGDRGNIVYWNEKKCQVQVLKAQEVFALSVLSELAYLDWQTDGHMQKTAVAVNDPTSMRIEEIAKVFGAQVFRAEVGEANVVNLAREKRRQGYNVPILGEGSNGGNITHPAAVRDPINTVLALIKLLTLRDSKINGIEKPGLFHRWCIKSGQEKRYKQNFTLEDVTETLPLYTTTGVSEKRALLNIKTLDHALLKNRFQKIFEKEWEKRKDELTKKHGIVSYQAICNNGTKETKNLCDYSVSGRGGLKILFKDAESNDIAYIWMRGSGTEPVFRILCDVKGKQKQMEGELLEWETQMLLQADSTEGL